MEFSKEEQAAVERITAALERYYANEEEQALYESIVTELRFARAAGHVQGESSCSRMCGYCGAVNRDGKWTRTFFEKVG